MKKKSVLEGRLAGLDILRTVAFFCVPTVHFFLNSGFYGVVMDSPSIIPLLTIRWIVYAGGVPVFIMLTGYLKRNKTVSWSHYRTIIPILVSYFVIAIITTIFTEVYLKPEPTTLYLKIRNIFAFNSPTYAWYIGMYIGLFLLIPFLNNAYNGLKTKKEKQILIGSMLFLIAVPASLNRIIVIQEQPFGFISSYWKNSFWQMGYYFIGIYIAEYKPKIDKLLNVLLILIFGVYQAVRTYLTGYGETFFKGMNAEYNDMVTFIVSVLVFLLFYDLNTEKKTIKSLAYVFAKHSMSAYLISSMFDIVIYKWFRKPEYLRSEHGYAKFFLPCVLMVILGSTLTAYIIEIPSGLISKGITKVLDKIVNRNKLEPPKKDITDDYNENSDTEVNEENDVFSDSQIAELLEGGNLDDEIDRFERDKVNI